MSKDIPLREKKFAKTKLAIADEFMRQLKTTRFDDISIQSVCEVVEISEGTFYNYFPRKFDVLIYHLQLQETLRIWRINQHEKKTSILSQIDLFFELIAEEFAEPHIVYELMTTMISERFEKKPHDLSAAEKLYAFPDHPEIEKTAECCPEEYFTDVVIDAQRAGELDPTVKAEELVVLLLSILCGVLLAIPTDSFDKASYYMKKQLGFLWKGIGRVENVQ